MTTPQPSRSRLIGALISCSLIGSMTACGAAVAPDTSTVTVSGPSTAASTIANPVTIYYMNDQATGLVQAVRSGPDTPARVKAALTVLANDRVPDGALPSFPTGTEIISVSIVGDEARVDLTSAFAANYPTGGAAAESAVLAPIVFTATEVPGVASVRLTVNGDVPQIAGSQYDFAAPFTRDDFPDLPVSAA